MGGVSFVVLQISFIVMVCVLMKNMYILLEKKNKTSFHVSLVGVSLWVTVWILGQIIDSYFRALTNRVNSVGAYFHLTCVICVPLFLINLCYNYVNNDKKQSILVKLALCLPTVMSVLVLYTNKSHNLFFIQYSNVNTSFIPGRYYSLHSVIYYSYLVGCIVYLLSKRRNQKQSKNKVDILQNVLMVAGIIVPIAINILIDHRIIEIPIYTLAGAYIVTVITWDMATVQIEMANVKKIASRHIFNGLDDSILVLSKGKVIVDFNEKLEYLLKGTLELKKGMSLTSILDSTKNLDIANLITKIDKAIFDSSNKVTREFLTLKGATKYYEISVTEIDSLFYIVAMKDITTRHWQTIEVLIKSIDAKNKYTCGHSYRVAEYSVKIGAQLGLDRDTLYLLWTCGLSHDIGKIGISDEILNSTERFAKDSPEYKEIMRHTDIGESLLSSMEEFKEVAYIVKCHHERIDGNGYMGLKGYEIPLLSRILSVADAYDAMSSGRAYQGKNIKEPYEVINILMDSSVGTQLDEECFYALVSVLIKEGYIESEMVGGKYIGTGKIHEFLTKDSSNKLAIKEDVTYSIEKVSIESLYRPISSMI